MFQEKNKGFKNKQHNQFFNSVKTLIDVLPPRATSANPLHDYDWFEYELCHQIDLMEVEPFPYKSAALDIAGAGMLVLGDNNMFDGSPLHQFILSGIEIGIEMGVIYDILASTELTRKIKPVEIAELARNIFHPEKNHRERRLTEVPNILSLALGLPVSDTLTGELYDDLISKEMDVLSAYPPGASSAEKWLTLAAINVNQKINQLKVRKDPTSLFGVLVNLPECWDLSVNMRSAAKIATSYSLTLADMRELVEDVFTKTNHPITLIEFAQICHKKQQQKIKNEIEEEERKAVGE